MFRSKPRRQWGIHGMMQRNSAEIFSGKIEDIPEIARLEKLCFSAPWSENALLETMSREETFFLVAKCGESICGYVGCYYVLDEGYITNVAVDPEYRRLGIGRALIEELTKRARDKKLAFLTLEVRASNGAAIALYEKTGFEKVGRRPRFYSDPCEDAELMTLYI